MARLVRIAAGERDESLAFRDYTVNYNAHHILDITFRASFVAAYPSAGFVHRTFDLSKGTVLTASDLFRADKRRQLASLLNARVQRAISTSQLAQDDEERSWHFSADKLGNFIVQDESIVFFFEFNLAFVERSRTPQGEFSMGARELKPFLRRGGPLPWLQR